MTPLKPLPMTSRKIAATQQSHLRVDVGASWFFLSLLILSYGCTQPAELPSDLMPVAHPDLSAIEAVAQRQLEDQRQAIDKVLAQGGDRLKLASAFGGMGELYHAYELFDAAAACYQNAATLDPESFLWPYYLGALQQASGDLEGAASNLERALTLRADDPAAHRRLGDVRLALGDSGAASPHFQALLDGNDEAFAAAAHFGLGTVAAAAGNAQQAVSHFETTLELQPDASLVHHPLGLALRDLGRLEEARERLAQKGAGEVRSSDRLMERVESLAISSGAHLKRGNRALMSGRLEDAEAELRKAVAADGKNTGARRNLALVLARKNDFDGAISQLKSAAEVDPSDVWIHVDLGNAYLGKGQGEAAARSFQQAVELDPDLLQARFSLANALIGLSRWQEAKPHLELVAERDPADRRARYQLAMTRHQAEEHPAAIEELRAVLKEEPTFTVARLGLGTVLSAVQRNAEAIAIYRQGLDLDLPTTEKAELLTAQANLHWRQGQRQAALASWRRMTELLPDSSAAWMQLANALQLSAGKEGAQQQEARQLFAKAVELDPTNATAWLSEARLWILDHEFSTALVRLNLALTHAPDHAGLNDTLARLLATCSDNKIRDGQRARSLAQKAYSLEGSIAHAETFGMALAELGRFEEAIRWQRSLINEAARIGDQAALPRLAGNLRRYENQLPVRMAAKP